MIRLKLFYDNGSLNIQLMERGLGMGYLDQTQYLRVYMAQLRKKIEDDPSKPRLLNTESGIGYRFGG